jgi:hypothetical protein
MFLAWAALGGVAGSNLSWPQLPLDLDTLASLLGLHAFLQALHESL